MKGVADLYKNDIEKGVASIKKFSVSEEEAKAFNFRCAINGSGYDSFIEPDNYVKLYVNDELYMSDTPFEKRTNFEFIKKANGDVMIAGLGIGLIIENLRESVKTGKVKTITIYEKYQDVIDIVSPIYSDMPIVYKCEDILEYKPSRDEKYDTIYFDIWPDVCYNNLEDIKLLHNRWKFHLKRENPDCWMDSWMKKTCQWLNKH